ncbi:MAG: rhomboid family intramembrane serine protease [Rhodobacteraceae bacterium]|nr:rhomboid family intramembrane serine protease [Paracoccaceae bacterium]
MRSVPSIVWLLLAVALVPELLLSGADMGLWGNLRWRGWAFHYGGFWAALLDDWRPNYSAQPYAMFFTYGFLHAGPVHFLVNAITLLSLSPPLAESEGTLRFLLVFVASLFGGAAVFALLSPVPAPMIGMSGALFGLAGALLAREYADRAALSLALWPVIQTVLGLVAMNVVLWWAMHGHLAWQTHLGGFLAGWVVTSVPARFRR